MIVYQQAVLIYDLTNEFCNKNMNPIKDRRTIEQMIQAGRSGKQNIVEASLEKSLKINIKLTGVARASFGELLEDYADFLRVRGLPIWDRNDPRVWKIRNAYKTNRSNGSNKSNVTYRSYMVTPEYFANLMITMISTENYLLDQMLRSLEAKFIREGGYSENLTKKRLAYRSNWTNKPNRSNFKMTN